MTTNLPAIPAMQPVPVPFDCNAWLAEDAERQAAFKEELALTKTRLFDALAAMGIVLVTVEFDGYGDSGQIEEMSAFGLHGEVALSDLTLVPADEGTSSGNDDNDALPLKDAVESLAYDLLESEHGGWENNDGAYGEFSFDVANRTITLSHNQRYVSSEHFETSW